MEDNLNERRPEWKTNSMKNNLTIISMEEDIKEALQEADDIRLPS